MEEEVESLNCKLELLEKENFDLKTETKNLKRIIALSKTSSTSVDEISQLKAENQKLKKMIDQSKTNGIPNSKEPSIFSNQDLFTQELTKQF